MKKRDWMRKKKDEIIGELLDYLGHEQLCEDDDHIENCPTCEAMRAAIDNCIGIVRCGLEE